MNVLQKGSPQLCARRRLRLHLHSCTCPLLLPRAQMRSAIAEPTLEYRCSLLPALICTVRAQPARTTCVFGCSHSLSCRRLKNVRVLGLASGIAHRGLDASLDRFLEAQRRQAPSKPDLTQALSFLNCRPSNAAAPGPLVNLLLLRCLSTILETHREFQSEKRRRGGVTALSARARRSHKTGANARAPQPWTTTSRWTRRS